jgi:hypothetical protein
MPEAYRISGVPPPQWRHGPGPGRMALLIEPLAKTSSNLAAVQLNLYPPGLNFCNFGRSRDAPGRDAPGRRASILH